MLGYIVLSVGSYSFYHYIIKTNKWQDRFQDYRALAEALRVQFYWSVAALPIAASDNYLRKQAGELGWIQFALRGPAVWSTSLALNLKTAHKDAVAAGWIENQIEFFIGKDRRSGKSKQNEDAARRNKRAASLCFLFAMGLVSTIFVTEQLQEAIPPRMSCLAWLLGVAKGWADWFDVAAVTLSAVAASLTVSTDLRAYKAHAHNYKQMGDIFQRAECSLRIIGDDDSDKYQELIRELGREALSENAEWLMDHRDREVEPGP